MDEAHETETGAEDEAAAGGAEAELDVPASPEETWEAITDPERLGEWLAEEAELDLRPGGGLRVRTADGERRGFIEEVDAPRRLAFWWSTEGEESSRVEIELEPARAGTRVRVVESRPLRTLSADDARTQKLCALA